MTPPSQNILFFFSLTKNSFCSYISLLLCSNMVSDSLITHVCDIDHLGLLLSLVRPPTPLLPPSPPCLSPAVAPVAGPLTLTQLMLTSTEQNALHILSFKNLDIRNFLAVQWLGLGAFTARSLVGSLVRELRSCKLSGVPPTPPKIEI